MSDYSGQNLHGPCTYAYVEGPGFIDVDTADLLREAIISNPAGPEAHFIDTSQQWTIRIERTSHGLVPNYDSHVGRMCHDLESDIPAIRTLGNMMASSLGIELLSDGR